MTVHEFVRERDEVLMSGDLDRVVAYLTKYSGYAPSSRKVAEIALHKARTGAKSLPLEMRKASKAWLVERGYKSFDDGDL